MAVTHDTTARNAATDGVTGTLGASPRLTFRVGGTVGAPGPVAATLVMSTTGFAAAVSGTATANAITSDTNAAGNASPVSKAAIQTSGGTVRVYCDVAASASDINMTNGLTIAAGDTVSCSSLTYTALVS
jgi:hypothetical protein